MRRWIKILFILLVALVIFITIDIVFNTAILYRAVSDEPIHVYWASTPVQQAENQTSTTSVQVGEFAPPQYIVNELKLSVSDAFSNSNMAFQIDCGNYTQNISFFASDGSGLNLTKITEYKNNNSPDIMVTCPLLKDGNFSSWMQLWQQYQQVYPYQPLTTQFTKPFLTQTSFDTWEGKFRFDDSFGMIPINETFNINSPLNYELFLTANVSRISFEITLPDHYDVQNSGDVDIVSTPNTPISSQNQFIVSKTITSGETFELFVTDKNLEPWQNSFGYVSSIGITAIVISICADLLIQYLWNKQSDNDDASKKSEKIKPEPKNDDKPAYSQPQTGKRKEPKPKKSRHRRRRR